MILLQLSFPLPNKRYSNQGSNAGLKFLEISSKPSRGVEFQPGRNLLVDTPKKPPSFATGILGGGGGKQPYGETESQVYETKLT